MAYIKPQSPLTHGENFIYPITTHDQIVLPDGSRWDGVSNKVSSVNGKEGAVVLTAQDVGAASIKVVQGTIWPADWHSSTKSGFAYVDEVTADCNIIVTPAPDSYTVYHNCGIYCDGQSAGTLSFKATTVPDDILDIQLIIFE